MTASSSGRRIARAAADALGATGRPRMVRMYDEAETTHVDVMMVDDAPSLGLTAFSTMGLHTTINLLDGKDIRVEFVVVAPTGTERVENLIAHAAFQVVKDAWLAAPGGVYPGLVTEYGLSEGLPHLMLTSPFPFANLARVSVEDAPTVHWLLAFAIAETERLYLYDHGLDAFEQLLEERDTPYWDLSRAPVA